MQVNDVMTEATVTESATGSLRSAAELMWRQRCSPCIPTCRSRTQPGDGQTVDQAHLPVVQGRQLLGVVSMRDVTGVFAALSLAKVNVEHEFDHLVRERRLARIELGDPD